MNILAVTQAVVMLLMITACGYLLRCKRMFTDETIRGINAIVLNVA